MEEIKKLKPLNGNILVRDDKKKEQTASGIYIPDAAANHQVISGTVVDISWPWVDDKGNRQEIRNLSSGDSILYAFTAGAGGSWKVDDNTYRVVRQVEILAKIVE